MDTFYAIAEHKIEEAMREGVFDNLPCKGQPLDLSENPFEPPALRMAHHLLRVNGFAPFWIEESNDIDRSVCPLRADLSRLRVMHDRRRGCIDDLRAEARALNRRIATFNLKAPSVRLHKPPFDWEAELETDATIGK